MGLANWLMPLKTIILFFPNHSTEAVSSAAVQALKSLGHEIVSTRPGQPPYHSNVEFRAKRGSSFDSKEWELSVLEVGGETRAAVTRRSGSFKGGQRKVNEVGMELFNSMKVLLA